MCILLEVQWRLTLLKLSRSATGKLVSQMADETTTKQRETHEYEVYVTWSQLKLGYGLALIDTGSYISMINGDKLKQGCKIINSNEKFVTVSGEVCTSKGQVELQVQETIHKFEVMPKPILDYTFLLGRDWLSKSGIQLKLPWITYGTVKPRSQTVVSFPVKNDGIFYVEKQELGQNVYVAEGVAEAKGEQIKLLVLNLNEEEFQLDRIPELSRWERLEGDVEKVKQSSERNRILKEKLRLEHIKEGKEEIWELCKEYSDIFRVPGDRLTEIKEIQHVINTPMLGSQEFINVKPYRIPEAHKQEIDEQIKSMLQQDIIRPSKSPYNFPILVVPKKVDASKKKKWRICIDYRKLNEYTVGDSFPIPNIQDILDQLGKARYFTALDCASGYWQLCIREEDKCKTAFSTREGHFEFNRMPFGLKTAPATYQRFMNYILAGLLGIYCFVYLDDVIIFGKSLEEHNSKLRVIFDQLRKYHVQLEPDKCEFLKTELQYLGHVVTKEGVRPDEKKVEAIQNFPTPLCPKDVKSFLGLAGYYRKFIRHFSQISSPLSQLLKKGVEWKWEQECEQSFMKLKIVLSSEPILQYPDFTTIIYRNHRCE